MKNFMSPKNPILRENLSETQSSPTPKPRSSSSSSRKTKSSKENAPPADPNTLHDSPSKPPFGKSKPHLPPRPPNPLKRKLSMDALAENSVAGGSDNGVKVIVRMRPPTKNEEEGDAIVQKVSPDSLTVLSQTFTFDSVADTNSTQQEIFQLVGAPLVENCLAGFNSSIFAYGQTGSGKTYTMWGPANALLERNIANSQQGLTPRVFEQLFKRIEEEQVKHAEKQLKYQCRCSFLEIYNEQITDLLDPAQRNLQIREDVKSGVYVENLTEDVVCTMEDVTRILVKGFSNRKIGATSLNAESSRSHSVFTCVVESRCKSASDGLSSIRISRINLVDLAGSERQKLTGTAGERLKEAGNINRSLSQLGNLINILAELSQSGKQRHIPYRDSRLTFLLQESLGGNAKLAMICAISPASSCKSETFSTLRFAQRAKAIKNKAVVNEETQDDVNVLREVIRQLKDELLRMKENGNPINPNGGYLTSWNARRSLNLLKMSFSRPRTLPHVEGDSDEEMEIDEEAVERLCVQAGQQIAGFEEKGVDDREAYCERPDLQIVPFDASKNVDNIVANLSVDMDCVSSDSHLTNDRANEEAAKENRVSSDSHMLKRKPEGEIDVETESVDGGSEIVPVASLPHESLTSPAAPVLPSELSITSASVLADIKSPPLSVSPRVSSSRKSLKTSSLLSASQKNLSEEKRTDPSSKNCRTSTEHLAESLHRGLQIIDSHRQSSALRRSSFRFSYKPVDLKSILPVGKVDVGVQTLPQEEYSESDEASSYLCGDCKNRIICSEYKETDEHLEMQLVPVDGLQSADKSKKQVPKAVEKVLAGAIRREMALEEVCSKQTAEISQLNRLVQQYKHERECNAMIEQTREDKIRRLESLMDGVLPTEEFMEEELLSLSNEHKLLKAKYDNHPEILRTRIELSRVQDELDGYRNFFDMGEKDVLIEEIQHLRSQLKYYVDSSLPNAAKKQSSLLRLTHSDDPISTPLSTIPESAEECIEDKVEQETVPESAEDIIEEKVEQETVPESAEESGEDKFEEERRRWTEVESNWISLAEELKTELEASRCLAEKQKRELESEKKCSEELKEAMQMAMQGHARILEQYADLQENHFALLARHRKMQEGIDDVKRAAARAGVKGAESRFINSLAAEISALRAEKEKEKRYLMDENKGLQAQLRDTAEAVQAAGELLVRLKEAEEAVSIAEKRALEAEQEAEKAYKHVDDLKKEHDREISRLNHFLAESRLPKEALRPVYDNSDTVKYDATECLSAGDDKWREEFEQIYHAEEDTELSKLPPWFVGYDRCNI